MLELTFCAFISTQAKKVLNGNWLEMEFFSFFFLPLSEFKWNPHFTARFLKRGQVTTKLASLSSTTLPTSAAWHYSVKLL